MSKFTVSSGFPQTPNDDTGAFPVMGYRLLAQQTLFASAPDLHEAMRAIECRVAQRILAWVSYNPHYATYLHDLTDAAIGSAFMGQLCFGLYRQTDAAMWLKWDDANGSMSLLWQNAVLTAARLIKTA